MSDKSKKDKSDYEILLLENVLAGDEPEASLSAAILNRINEIGDDNETSF